MPCNIILQDLVKDSIIGHLALGAVDLFWNQVVGAYEVKYALPKINLLWKLKFASMIRIARGLVTGATPAAFSSMTERLHAHLSGAEPV